MLNKALMVEREKLNEFTQEIKNRCLRDGKALVKTREGAWVEVSYDPEHEEYGETIAETFTVDSPRYSRWYANGESITSHWMDLIEIAD